MFYQTHLTRASLKFHKKHTFSNMTRLPKEVLLKLFSPARQQDVVQQRNRNSYSLLTYLAWTEVGEVSPKRIATAPFHGRRISPERIASLKWIRHWFPASWARFWCGRSGRRRGLLVFGWEGGSGGSVASDRGRLALWSGWRRTFPVLRFCGWSRCKGVCTKWITQSKLEKRSKCISLQVPYSTY